MKYTHQCSVSPVKSTRPLPDHPTSFTSKSVGRRGLGLGFLKVACPYCPTSLTSKSNFSAAENSTIPESWPGVAPVADVRGGPVDDDAAAAGVGAAALSEAPSPPPCPPMASVMLAEPRPFICLQGWCSHRNMRNPSISITNKQTRTIATNKNKINKNKNKIFGFRLFSRQDSTPVTDSVTSIQIHSVCQLFTLLIDVCPLYSSEILSGLAFHEGIVPGLWRLLPTLGPEGNMKIFLRAATTPGAEPLIEVLSLACNTAARLLLVLDDREVYVYIDTWRVLCGGWLRVFIRTCVYTYMCTCVHVHARNARVFFLACHCTLTTRMHAKQCHLATQHNRYDTEVPLSLEMLKEMSKFLNNFIFNALWHRVKAR